MELGGAEMALLGLLHALDPNRVDVDLFIYSHQGPLMEYIPDWVNLLPQIKPYSMIERPMAEALKAGCFRLVLRRLKARRRAARRIKRYGDSLKDDAAIMQYVGDAVTPVLPKITDRIYDLAISFLTPHNIVRDKISARRKIAWIHTDYSTVTTDIDNELPAWTAFDHIISISSAVTKSFLTAFPSLSSKIIEMENILPVSYIQKRSKALINDFPYQGEGPFLLSIGRFCTAKNYDNVPDIARCIVYSGFTSLRWYIIGYGPDEALIRAKIEEAGMQEHVILLGKKENPYPYIKACDIYVQPSRYEGKSVTVREAQILRKPVVVTNYPTASSQINDGEDGIIVPLDNEGCAHGLSDFLSNKALQDKICINLRQCDYAGQSEVHKIYDLVK